MARLGGADGPRTWKVSELFVDLLGQLENESKAPFARLRPARAGLDPTQVSHATNANRTQRPAPLNEEIPVGITSSEPRQRPNNPEIYFAASPGCDRK